MHIRRFMLTLAVAAMAVLGSGDLRAQEYTLPPAPSSATDQDGAAFLPESGPCFYNPYKWSSRALLNRSLIGGEIQDLASGWGGLKLQPGCLDRYGLTGYDFLGNWSYMIADGVPMPPPSPPRARVLAVWAASLKAAEEGRTQITMHEPVPMIGDGYGSDELEGRTLRFKVRPDSGAQPNTYLGVPIIERGRFWERNQAVDGRRTWRVVELEPDSYAGRRNGVRSQNGMQTFRSLDADRRIQAEEGLRPVSRSPFPRSPSGAASSSDGASSSPSTSSGASSRPMVRPTKKEQ